MNQVSALPIIEATLESDMQACKTSGDCCKCGLCCFAYDIEVPKPVDGVPGTVDPSGETVSSPPGECCPHLIAESAIKFRCALHGTPHKPTDCSEWQGSTGHYVRGVSRQLANSTSESDIYYGGEYNRMLHNMYRSIIQPRSGAVIENIKMMMRSGALVHFRGNEQARSDVEASKPELNFQGIWDFEKFLKTYLIRYECLEEGIFDLMHVREYFSHLRSTSLDSLKGMLRNLFADCSDEMWEAFVSYVKSGALEE